MPKKMLPSAVVSVLAVFAVPAANCQEPSKTLPKMWQCPTIFLAEIEQMNIGPGADPALPGVQAKVTRVLRDDLQEGLHPAGFDAPHIFGFENVVVGRSYLFFSHRKEGLADTLESPYGMYPITEADDPVGDIDLILGLASLPTSQRAHEVAVSLGSPGKPHTAILARYAVVLLAAGPDSDTEELAQALDSMGGQSFSEDAKISLLVEGELQVGMQRHPPRNLAASYVNLCVRFFLAQPESPDGRPSGWQGNFLTTYLPPIRRMDGELVNFRSVISPAVAAQLRKKLADIAGDGRLQPYMRDGARQFLTFLDSR